MNVRVLQMTCGGSGTKLGVGSPQDLPILKITRKDIAAAAGVSVSTVGMILSGKGENYNPDTRKLVEETAAQLGYQPSINARALRLQRSLLIGVLLNEVNAHLAAEFLSGVQSAIQATDYSPVVFFIKDGADQQQCLERCLHRQVDALIVNCAVDEVNGKGVESFSARLKKLQIPVIEVFGRFLEGLPKVNVDNAEAGRLCASHLAALGHKRIALVTHERYDRREKHFDAWEHFCGYRDALKAGGLEPVVITPPMDFEHIDISSFLDAGHAALELMLAQTEVPTAAVCYSDVMACGLNRACREKGIRVPQDFAIAGNFDMLLSSIVNPPLTTTRSNHFEIGHQAAELLLRSIDGDEVESCLVAPALLERKSAGPVAGGK